MTPTQQSRATTVRQRPTTLSVATVPARSHTSWTTTLAMLAPCNLHVRSDLGITLAAAVVSSWGDQSGSGNNVVQATAGKRPGFTASVAAINGQPSVNCDGVDDVLRATGINVSGAAGRTAAIVFKFNAAFSAAAGACDGGANNEIRLYRTVSSTGLACDLDGGVHEMAATTFTPESWSYYTLLGVGGGGTSYIQDKLVKRATRTDVVPITFTGFSLGTAGDGTSQPGNLSIAEMIVFGRAISATEQAWLCARMANRYNL